MATCSSILAWKIPWTEEPGRLQSMGSQRVRHDWEHTAHNSGKGQFPTSWRSSYVYRGHKTYSYMHLFYGFCGKKKSGRVPFDLNYEANSYKCQVKEVAGKDENRVWWTVRSLGLANPHGRLSHIILRVTGNNTSLITLIFPLFCSDIFSFCL